MPVSNPVYGLYVYFILLRLSCLCWSKVSAYGVQSYFK